jgi:hypothetical protein
MLCGGELKASRAERDTYRLLLAVQELVRPVGLEPTTFGSGGRRSIQLSYGRTTRTRETEILA